MLTILAKLFRLFSSDIAAYQLSLGISFGIVMGLSPIISIQSFIVILLLFVLRVNLTIFLVSLSAVSLIAYLADSLIVMLGQNILLMPSLQNLFTDMYNSGYWRLFNFNNTAAMGSLVISLIIFIPVFWSGIELINRYRSTVDQYWHESKIYNYMKKSKLLSKIAAISQQVN